MERENSTHKVEVVPVRLERHPNADRLSVVKVFGYTVCTGTAEWLARPMADFEHAGEGPYRLGAYVPPDSLCPINRPEFTFLADQDKGDGFARIKAKKLRGVVSFGLLVPAPPGSKIGDNVADILGVKHYEPPLEEEQGAKRFAMGGEVAPGPNVHTVKYDVDAFRRYHQVFQQGEPVIVTEKVDGSSAKYVFHDGQIHCSSRTEWKREYPSYEHLTVESLIAKGCEEEKAREVVERLQNKPVKKNLWWYALERCPSLRAFCEAYPDYVVYGEVFGRQGKLKYTNDPDEVFFAAFDIMTNGRWMDGEEARKLLEIYEVPVVPLVLPQLSKVLTYTIPYDFDTICSLAEGPSLWRGANCLREGVVVKPVKERYDHQVGRVCLKAVSATYLERCR